MRGAGRYPVEYRSPRGTYTVQLTGRRSLPKLPLLHHVVFAQIRKGSEPLVRDWDVHFADWFDSGFDDQYTDGGWPAENVLRLRAAGDLETARRSRGRRRRDEPIGTRASPVSIQGFDLFFVLDLPPDAIMQLRQTGSPQSGDHSFMRVGGVWANGAKLPKEDFDFLWPDRRSDAPFRDKVDVRPDGVDVRETQHGARRWTGTPAR